MPALTQTTITCPYCAECVDVLIDPSDIDQQYIEDCQVCCRPIVIVVTATPSGEPSLAVYSENDVY